MNKKIWIITSYLLLWKWFEQLFNLVNILFNHLFGSYIHLMRLYVWSMFVYVCVWERGRECETDYKGKQTEIDCFVASTP